MSEQHDFAWAFQRMKGGAKVLRDTWRESGRYIFQGEYAFFSYDPVGFTMEYMGNSNDLMADDWVEFDSKPEQKKPEPLIRQAWKCHKVVHAAKIVELAIHWKFTMTKIPLAAALLLTACTGQSGPTQYATAIADIQAAYHVTEALVSAQIANDAIPAVSIPAIQAAEAKADPVVAALSSTSDPTTASAALADAQTLADALPPGALTADVVTAIAVAHAALQPYQAWKSTPTDLLPY